MYNYLFSGLGKFTQLRLSDNTECTPRTPPWSWLFVECAQTSSASLIPRTAGCWILQVLTQLRLSLSQILLLRRNKPDVIKRNVPTAFHDGPCIWRCCCTTPPGPGDTWRKIPVRKSFYPHGCTEDVFWIAVFNYQNSIRIYVLSLSYELKPRYLYTSIYGLFFCENA